MPISCQSMFLVVVSVMVVLVAVCCWVLVVMWTDAPERARRCTKLLPTATLISSLCFSVLVEYFIIVLYLYLCSAVCRASEVLYKHFILFYYSSYILLSVFLWRYGEFALMVCALDSSACAVDEKWKTLVFTFGRIAGCNRCWKLGKIKVVDIDSMQTHNLLTYIAVKSYCCANLCYIF